MFRDPEQSSAASYSNPPRKARKRHKPIARITSYDYNVFYDIRRKQEVRNGKATRSGLFSTPIRKESYNVMEGEILMSIDKSTTYRDGQLHCFSFANGLGQWVSTDSGVPQPEAFFRIDRCGAFQIAVVWYWLTDSGNISSFLADAA